MQGICMLKIGSRSFEAYSYLRKYWLQPPILGLEDVGASPLDRKDALTRRPLDFDQEEETRKVETSKWLEHHFGSESRSSNNSTVEEEEQPPKTSFFNVTIKSQPSRTEPPVHNSYVSTVKETSRVYSPVEPERDRNNVGGYYKGKLVFICNPFPLKPFWLCLKTHFW